MDEIGSDDVVMFVCMFWGAGLSLLHCAAGGFGGGCFGLLVWAWFSCMFGGACFVVVAPVASAFAAASVVLVVAVVVSVVCGGLWPRCVVWRVWWLCPRLSL